MPNNNKIICFKQDTKERKSFFKAASFTHPAKMILGLQIYLIENYTKPGDTILDPMAGSGTILVACALGRNVVCMELEKKFVDMQKDNWEKIQTLGPMMFCKMGEAVILQGDSRNLDGLLADNIICSPPYAETGVGDWKTGRAEFQEWVIGELATKGYVEWQGKRYNEKEWRALNHGRIDGRTTKGVHKHPTDGYGETQGQIGNLPYGEISAVISSPPFGEAHNQKGLGVGDNDRKDLRDYSYLKTNTKGQIGNLPYGKADAVITPSPYAETIAKGQDGETPERLKGFIGESCFNSNRGYSKSDDNIGNLKSENYLQAMLQVYRQCHKVLKEKGLMVLVVKPFIRNKKIVRLDLDTIKLCEQAGFKLIERLKRKLNQQSFWRIIALLKCDNRKHKQKNKCKLGLKCPVKDDDKMTDTLFFAKDREKILMECQKTVEKLCPKYINTVPKIEYENILVFQRIDRTNNHCS